MDVAGTIRNPDEGDAVSNAEFEGAKRVIAALVRKYGRVELKVEDILTVDLERLHITANVASFSYRYEATESEGNDR